jgi:hypothetical protein
MSFSAPTALRDTQTILTTAPSERDSLMRAPSSYAPDGVAQHARLCALEFPRFCGHRSAFVE